MLTDHDRSLVLEYMPIALSLATKYGSPILSRDDLYQIGCYKITELIESGEHLKARNLKQFMWTSVRNSMINAIRREKWYCQADNMDMLRVTKAEDMSEDHSMLMAKCVGMLTVQQQQIVWWRVYDHLRITDIAKRLGVTRDAVNGRIKRIKAKVQSLYRKELERDKTNE